MLDVAAQVQIEMDQLNEDNIIRYSNRQKAKIKLDCLSGKVLYKGDITEFMPYLRIAEIIHVGKGTAMGLGKIKIIKD